MRDNRDWVLWREYQCAWDRAELLQAHSQGESFRFGVIYDTANQRWRVNCIDVEQPTTERFHGGHRRYYLEVWREG